MGKRRQTHAAVEAANLTMPSSLNPRYTPWMTPPRNVSGAKRALWDDFEGLKAADLPLPAGVKDLLGAEGEDREARASRRVEAQKVPRCRPGKVAAQILVGDDRRRSPPVQGAVRLAINGHVGPAKLDAQAPDLNGFGTEKRVDAHDVGALDIGAVRLSPAPWAAEVTCEPPKDCPRLAGYQDQITDAVERRVIMEARAIDSPCAKEFQYAVARLLPKEWTRDFHVMPPSRQHKGRVACLSTRHDVGLLNLAVAVGRREVASQPVDGGQDDHPINVDSGGLRGTWGRHGESVRGPMNQAPAARDPTRTRGTWGWLGKCLFMDVDPALEPPQAERAPDGYTPT